MVAFSLEASIQIALAIHGSVIANSKQSMHIETNIDASISDRAFDFTPGLTLCTGNPPSPVEGLIYW